MPEDEIQNETSFRAKPFSVYWNVPTMQCRSKGIPFENLYEKYGIIQNKNDEFRGEKIAILYDPGWFPALLKNETSGKFKFRNGGVPQEGDLDKHLEVFKSVLEQSIPDEQFDGVGIIDFESWRPVFRQNFGVLVPYKDTSYEIERRKHWWWTNDWIRTAAKNNFESAAREFMQATITLARRQRPRGRWGYYGFPYCFNGASAQSMEHCSKGVKEENDQTSWLWSSSQVLLPSVYSSQTLETSQLTAFIRGRVTEAARVARGTPVLPYFWYRYRDAGFLTQRDLNAALQTFYKSQAKGFIIWGSSGDVNTPEKCTKLLDYVDSILGPAIAKYAKTGMRDEENTSDSEVMNDGTTEDPINMHNITIEPIFGSDNTTDVNDDKNSTPDAVSKNPFETTTSSIQTQSINPEPESLWVPPENYEQNIIQHVAEELAKKYGHEHDSPVIKTFEESDLLQLIVKVVLNETEHNRTSKPINNDHSEPNVMTSQAEVSTKSVANLLEFTTQNPLPNVVKSNQNIVINVTKESSDNAYNFTSTTDSYISIENKYSLENEYAENEESSLSTTESYDDTSTNTYFKNEDDATNFNVDSESVTNKININTPTEEVVKDTDDVYTTTSTDSYSSTTETYENVIEYFDNEFFMDEELDVNKNNTSTTESTVITESLPTTINADTLTTDTTLSTDNYNKDNEDNPYAQFETDVDQEPFNDLKKELPSHHHRHNRMYTPIKIDITETETEITSSSNDMTEPLVSSKQTYSVGSKDKKKGLPRREESENETTDVKRSVDDTISLMGADSTIDQVSSSAVKINSFSKHKYFFCIFFYFYSISRCLCDVYKHCT
ncbi:uncharacterized protein LOC119692059 isoform X3 [Plutella xylostella]|nr:uncharacterized protein LOC119692059 isoform X3 [Plutella xylostella]